MVAGDANRVHTLLASKQRHEGPNRLFPSGWSAIRQFFPGPQTGQKELLLIRGRQRREVFHTVPRWLNQREHVRAAKAFGPIAFASPDPASATQLADGHQPLPSDTDLSRVLSIQEERTVQNDWTVRWQNGFLQLLRVTAGDLQPGQRVTVCEPLSGPLRIFAGERELRWSTARSEPSRRPPPRPATGPTKSSQGQKPAADHPWRGRQTRSPPPPPAAAAEYHHKLRDISNGLQHPRRGEWFKWRVG